MPQTSLSAVNTFTGVQDTDTDAKFIKETDFVSARNIRNGYGIDLGGIENILGNEVTTFHTLPSGTNKNIRCFEDEIENTLFYFIYNSNGNHEILRFYPTEGRCDVLAHGSSLNFDPNHYIHSVSLVDRTHLYWTDALETGTGLVGNEPRKLNVVKANNYQKKYQYEWHFALDDQFNYSTLNGTSIQVVGNFGLTITFSGITNRQSAIDFITAELSAAGFFIANTINQTLVFNSNVINQTITTDASTTWSRLVPYNFYGTSNISATHITWVKAQPQFAPTVLFIANGSGVFNRTFAQYATRFIYDDGEKSAWSAYSITPYNTFLSGYQTLIDFYDERLNSIDWLTIIKKVEIGVRYGNTQPLRTVKTLDTSEIGFTTAGKNILVPTALSNHFKHTDSFYTNVVGSDDNTSDNTVQVLKLYDNVPILSHTINMIADENGSTIAVTGNSVRGYDNIRTNTTTMLTTIDIYDESIDINIVPNGNRPLTTQVTLKPYGEYDWGILYYDRFGRSGAVQFCGTFITTNEYRQPQIAFNINHSPPSWAETYQIVRTKDKRQSSYKVYIDYGTMKTVVDGRVYWTLQNLKFNDAPQPSTAVQILFDTEQKSTFTGVKKGDRFRIWGYDAPADGELNILGYAFSATGQLSIITENTTLAGSHINEVFTPKINADDFYYETGIKLPIVGGFHTGNIQTQTSSVPCIVKLIGGDTKWTVETFNNIETIIFADEYYTSQKSSIRNEDIGRPNIVNANAKQEWFKNEIRFSERYNIHSEYNGLSAFRSLDYIEVKYEFGSIQKLEVAQHSLITICQHKIQPIYVNRDRLLDFNANQSIGRTNRILNIAQEVINNWGTRNPESVKNIHGIIYAWDSYNGIFWRFGSDGQTDMSLIGNVNNFASIGRERMTIARLTDKVVCGYEKKYKTLYITFSTTPTRPIFTMQLEDNERAKGWKDKVDFTPEQYGSINDLFYSFVNGIMWKHDSITSARCNFYGTQYNAEVTVSVNPEPDTIKTPKAFNIQSTNLFILPQIVVPLRSGYPLGQKSRIAQAAKFSRQEGQWFSVALKDYTDNAKQFTDIVNIPLRETTALLRGRDLKFESMAVTLRLNDPTVKARLYRLSTTFFHSENTKI